MKSLKTLRYKQVLELSWEMILWKWAPCKRTCMGLMCSRPKGTRIVIEEGILENKGGGALGEEAVPKKNNRLKCFRIQV